MQIAAIITSSDGLTVVAIGTGVVVVTKTVVSSVGVALGSSVGASVCSSEGTSVGSSMGTSVISSEGSLTGSSVWSSEGG